MTHLRLLLPILLCFCCLLGCGTAQHATQAQVVQRNSQNVLTAKMGGMSKEDRATYIRDHFNEVSAAALGRGPGTRSMTGNK